MDAVSGTFRLATYETLEKAWRRHMCGSLNLRQAR